MAGNARWQNYPFYNGPCPGGCDDGPDRPRLRGRRCCGMFLAMLPIAVAANGVVPLAPYNPCRNGDFEVNSGMVTLEKAGTYLATVTARLPEGEAMETMLTLNVDDASQTSAITQISGAGTGTSAYTSQAIFQAGEGATVTLRSSGAINVTQPSTQPMFTLSLVQLDE